MAALRTQIYLSATQRARLDEMGRDSGKSLAGMVREAVDTYLGAAGPSVEEAFQATFGALPDIAPPSRDEWDRHPE